MNDVRLITMRNSATEVKGVLPNWTCLLWGYMLAQNSSYCDWLLCSRKSVIRVQISANVGQPKPCSHFVLLTIIIIIIIILLFLL